jgi:preprotein translocase subunit SecD
MDRRYITLIAILLVVVMVGMVDLPNPPAFINTIMGRQVEPVLGLDLRGGVQILLQPPANSTFTTQNLQDAADILENRTNALGVSENVFQVAGGQYILAEFPGLKDPQAVIANLQQTGLLEFVDVGSTPLTAGTVVVTDNGANIDQALNGTATPESTLTTPQAANTATPTTAGPTPTPSGTETAASATVYHTVMTGADIKSVLVSMSTTTGTSGYVIQFTLTDHGKTIFAAHTSANVGKYLAIVLDKKVISCPQIDSAITDGSGVIQGSFTRDSANSLATTLRYGSLPVSLEIAQEQVIGPTLGEDSLNKSILAGIIGFAVVMLFMIIYYRLPGVVAVLAITVYGLVTFAIYKLIPITLTLPSIAGFLLSTGSAMDANILMFERMKEELRAGRNLHQAAELGWSRAWPSIRDSNISTFITSVILFIFGSAMGASTVKGFALTLALGIVISILTAVIVTRTFLGIALDLFKPTDRTRWFGL